MPPIIHVLVNDSIGFVGGIHKAAESRVFLHQIPGFRLGNSLIAILHHLPTIGITNKAEITNSSHPFRRLCSPFRGLKELQILASTRRATSSHEAVS